MKIAETFHAHCRKPTDLIHISLAQRYMHVRCFEILRVCRSRRFRSWFVGFSNASRNTSDRRSTTSRLPPFRLEKRRADIKARLQWMSIFRQIMGAMHRHPVPNRACVTEFLCRWGLRSFYGALVFSFATSRTSPRTKSWFSVYRE